MLTAALHHALSFIAGGLHRLVTSCAVIVRNRIALRQLAELDDYTLADIGLTRGDLVSAAAQPIYRDPYLVDPFDARRGVHARELDTLARWQIMPGHERLATVAEPGKMSLKVPMNTVATTPVDCSAECQA